jgi:murein DD-endopeptidase MepM/ murein hydrolase activator NlpD
MHGDTIFIMQNTLTGLLIVVILSACANYTPVVKPSINPYYTIQPGDSLDSITLLLEISPTLLIRMNPSIDPNKLILGSRLIVPDRQVKNLIDSPIPIDSYIWPLSKVEVSSSFGYRSGRLHTGIDLRAPRDTPIKASSSGKVIFLGQKTGYGKIIIIAHADGIESSYAHNHRNLVTAGQDIIKGGVIATVGQTGNSTGYHLHFELRQRGQAIDPKLYLPPYD